MDEKQQYGVSYWEDPDKIYDALHKLTSQPIYEVKKSEMDRILTEYFDTKCAKSKAISTEAKSTYPAASSTTLRLTIPSRSR